MINDCKSCHSMVYDSAVGWCCSLLKPMKLCEDITQEECPIRRKRYERFQLREALDIVNDRKTMLAEREAQKQAAVENAPKKPRKPRKKRVPKKTVEQQVVETAVKDNKDKVEKMSEEVKVMQEHRLDQNDGKLKELMGQEGYLTYCRGCVLAEMMEADLTLDGLKRACLRITKMIEDKEDE